MWDNFLFAPHESCLGNSLANNMKEGLMIMKMLRNILITACIIILCLCVFYPLIEFGLINDIKGVLCGVLVVLIMIGVLILLIKISNFRDK